MESEIQTVKNKKNFELPHTYVILFCIIIAVALLTFIVPAGAYDRIDDPASGRTIVDASSFHAVEKNSITLFSFFQSIPKGMQQTASIIFFIFIIGGAMQIITATGAIDAGVGKAARALKGNEKFMIPLFLLLFAIGGATFGLAEEVCIFVPIGIALARALGYDAVTGTAMIALGAATGCNAGFMNPFTVGVAQSISQLPLFSGMGLRIVLMAVCLIVTAWYIMRYAKKVKMNPESSIVASLESEEKHQNIDFENLPKTELKHTLVLLTILAGLAFIVFGVFKKGWFIDEIATVFLIIGIVCGLVCKMSPSKIAEEFVEGAKALTFGALCVGIARSILVVMQDAQIVDTVINGLSASILSLPKSVSVLGMYFVQLILNTFITSGSGLAATVMPIMSPISDIIGITRQTAVLAFQLGDGFTNSIIPTSPVLLAYLTVAKIPYEKWVKFIWPLMIIWITIGAVFLLVANAISYGPF